MVTAHAVHAAKQLYVLFGRMTPQRFTKPQIEALKASGAFSARVPPNCQAPKMADVCPTENV